MIFGDYLLGPDITSGRVSAVLPAFDSHGRCEAACPDASRQRSPK